MHHAREVAGSSPSLPPVKGLAGIDLLTLSGQECRVNAFAPQVSNYATNSKLPPALFNA